jgi:hypothetical protein
MTECLLNESVFCRGPGEPGSQVRFKRCTAEAVPMGLAPPSDRQNEKAWQFKTASHARKLLEKLSLKVRCHQNAPLSYSRAASNETQKYKVSQASSGQLKRIKSTIFRPKKALLYTVDSNSCNFRTAASTASLGLAGGAPYSLLDSIFSARLQYQHTS